MRRHSEKSRRNGQFAQAVRRFVRDPMAMGALLFLVIVAIAGIFYRDLAPYDPAEQLVGPPFSGPSGSHWLGTDNLGRDEFSRILQGAGLTLGFSVLVVLAALVVSVPIGLLAGYVGRWVDTVLMRIMDGLLSLPALVLAIAVVGMLGPGLRNAGIVVAIALVPGFARLIRGQALAVREEVFIDAAQAVGTPTRRIVWRHLLPNVVSPLIVQASVTAGFVVLFEASLSFLGLGAPPPTASWGSMLRDAYDNVLGHPWLAIPPGIAIVLTVLAYNLAGDGLRSALGVTQPVRRHGQLGLTTVARGKDDAPDAATAPDPTALLVVDRLSLEMMTPTGQVRVLDDVSFSIAPGETLGLVGESGSGKTVTSLSIMRLLPSPPARITGGRIWFQGKDLLSMPFREMSRVRGSELAMIFQDPMASLNPAMTISKQISQVVRWHEGLSKKDADKRMLDALEMVGISSRRAGSYPHEFSGGMRQRAMIAMALVCRPKLVIADEPTTALDVTIQAQVLELLHEMRSELGMAMLFVTHDLGVVADICDRVMVMYAGQVVETASVHELYGNPSHPYTEGLLRAMPQKAEPRSPLYAIPGQVPRFTELGSGCRLASRCAYVQDRCRQEEITLAEAGTDHLARCVRVTELDLAGKS